MSFETRTNSLYRETVELAWHLERCSFTIDMYHYDWCSMFEMRQMCLEVGIVV